MFHLARSAVFAIPIIAAAAILGCGKKDNADAGKVIVKGKLVDGGKPFAMDLAKIPLPKGATGVPPGTASSAGTLQVIFITADSNEQFEANVNAETGTFDVTGPYSKGILPGKYKIAVTGRHGFGVDVPDYFGGKFSPEKTQIIRDVKAGEEVVIDIKKPQG